jgi:hypothetical protein
VRVAISIPKYMCADKTGLKLVAMEGDAILYSRVPERILGRAPLGSCHEAASPTTRRPTQHIATMPPDPSTQATLLLPSSLLPRTTCTLPSQKAPAKNQSSVRAAVLEQLAGSCNSRIVKTASKNFRFTFLRTMCICMCLSDTVRWTFYLTLSPKESSN